MFRKHLFYPLNYQGVVRQPPDRRPYRPQSYEFFLTMTTLKEAMQLEQNVVLRISIMIVNFVEKNTYTIVLTLTPEP